jgi:hypothetical protein
MQKDQLTNSFVFEIQNWNKEKNKKFNENFSETAIIGNIGLYYYGNTKIPHLEYSVIESCRNLGVMSYILPYYIQIASNMMAENIIALVDITTAESEYSQKLLTRNRFVHFEDMSCVKNIKGFLYSKKYDLQKTKQYMQN